MNLADKIKEFTVGIEKGKIKVANPNELTKAEVDSYVRKDNDQPYTKASLINGLKLKYKWDSSKSVFVKEDKTENPPPAPPVINNNEITDLQNKLELYVKRTEALEKSLSDYKNQNDAVKSKETLDLHNEKITNLEKTVTNYMDGQKTRNEELNTSGIKSKETLDSCAEKVNKLEQSLDNFINIQDSINDESEEKIGKIESISVPGKINKQLENYEKRIDHIENGLALLDEATPKSVNNKVITGAIIASGISTVIEYAHASNLETTVTKNVQTNPAINWSDYYGNGTLTKPLPSEIETIPGYVSPWINFALQSGVNVLTALNMLNTYMEYKQASNRKEKMTKMAWMIVHGAVAISSKIYSWLSGEEIQSTFTGLSTGNTTYTSFENGAGVSLGALLFEGASLLYTLNKHKKKL